ncbi:MAG: AMP-binding protein [Paracoccaceae bacterium]
MVTTPDTIAMILFTSRTTGVPNGVQVTHRNLCNILQTAPGDMGMKPGLQVGQICPSPSTWRPGKRWARCRTGPRW